MTAASGKETWRGRGSPTRAALGMTLAVILVSGCASSATSATTSQTAAPSAVMPSIGPQKSEPPVVAPSARLEQLPAPLEVPVPVLLGQLTPVSKEGYRGWYTTATLPSELVKGVIGDWAASLTSQGYEVSLTDNRLDASLKGDREVPQATTSSYAEQDSAEEPTSTPSKDAFTVPEVPPTDTSWVQVRVLSAAGSEHSSEPGTAYIALAFLERA